MTPNQYYEKLVNNYLHRLDKGELSNSTVQGYIYSINNIGKLVGSPNGQFDPKLINENVDKLVDYFSDRDHSRDNLMTSLMMNYKILGLRIPEPLVKLNHLKMDQTAQVEANAPLKRLPFDNFSQVIDVFNNWDHKQTPLDKSQYLALAMFVYLPPQRSQEILSLRVVPDLPKEEKTLNEGNWFSLNDSLMVFNDFKTKRHYGQVMFEVPADLTKLVLDQRLVKVDGYDRLFTTMGGDIMSSSGFSQFFKKIKSLKGLTPIDLRNLYVSSLDGISMNERARISKIMKHSVVTQLMTYSKYNKVNFPDEED